MATFGVEIEFDSLVPAEVIKYIDAKNLKFSVVHDASIETPASVSKGIAVLGKDYLLQRRQTKIGCECASSVFNTQAQYLKEIGKLIKMATEMGEPEKSTRTSIHLHYGIPAINLELLKRILKYSLVFENYFFRLSGMGYEFRGLYNGCAYCRSYKSPLLAYDTNKNLRYCINSIGALQSKTVQEFWSNFGINVGDVPRYPLSRYVSINLVSILKHGTLELRVLNKTLNMDFIKSVVDFWTSFCNTLMIQDYQKNIREIDFPTDYLENISVDHFKEINKIFGLFGNSFDVGGITEILKETPVPKVDLSPRLNHLDAVVNSNFPLPPFLGDIEEIKSSEAITIHNIGNVTAKRFFEFVYGGL